MIKKLSAAVLVLLLLSPFAAASGNDLLGQPEAKAAASNDLLLAVAPAENNDLLDADAPVLAAASRASNDLLRSEETASLASSANDLLGETVRERARAFLRGLGEGDLVARGPVRRIITLPFRALKAVREKRAGGC